MKYEPTTILKLVDEGYEKNTTSVFSSTKRNGKWIETTVDEFRQQVRHFALGLYEIGVRKGDRVTLHSENCTEWLVCDQAILSLGAVNVPIYTSQPGEQIKFILENSDSKVHIVSNDELFEDTKPVIKSIKNVNSIITIQESDHPKLKNYHGVISLGARVDEEEPEKFEKLRAKVEPDDLASFIYTSGTTGRPKGVMLTHNNIASNVLGITERVPFDIEQNRGDHILSYLPLSHVFERTLSYTYQYIGYPIYYIEDIKQIRDDFQVVEPIMFATVPRLLEKIYAGVKGRGQNFSGLKKQLYYWALHLAEGYDPENPPGGMDALKHKIADKLVYSKIREIFGDNLLGMVSGGAALSPSIMSFMHAIGIYCGQGYGLSESSPVIAACAPGSCRIGSSGKPLTDVQVKIADDGEILARGPNIMKGYFRDEEKTNETLTEDGWLKTGDIGYLDEDGYLFITDRKKSVFKLSTGKYVAPQVIQNHLNDSPFIEQSVVVGYKRKFCSALIVPNYEAVQQRLKKRGIPRPETNLSENQDVINLIQDEVDKVNRHLSDWESVKKFVLLENQFTIEADELTPTLKVKRPVINQKYKKEIDSMYEEDKEAQVETG